MSKHVIDIESFKSFICDRTIETWEQLHIPYYLSRVSVELKKQGVDYRTFIGPLRLSQWATATGVPGTKFITHPHQKAKVGFIPIDATYTFSEEVDSEIKDPLAFSPKRGRGRALILFVETLINLPDESISDLQVPAKTLVALLKQ